MVTFVAETFVLVLPLLGRINTLPGITTVLADEARSALHCAAACSAHPDCGGFKWRPDKTAGLSYAASEVTAGITRLPVYRKLNFRGNPLLQLEGPSASTYNDAESVCESQQMILPPLPLNIIDEMILQLRPRGRQMLGLYRQDLNSKLFFEKTSEEPRDTSTLTWVEDRQTGEFLYQINNAYADVGSNNLVLNDLNHYCWKL